MCFLYYFFRFICSQVSAINKSDCNLSWHIYRKNAAVGYLCCPLLPVCLLISQSSDGFGSSHNEIFALGSLIISVLASAWTMRAESYNVMWLLAMTAVSIASVIWISTLCAVSQGMFYLSDLYDYLISTCLLKLHDKNMLICALLVSRIDPGHQQPPQPPSCWFFRHILFGEMGADIFVQYVYEIRKQMVYFSKSHYDDCLNSMLATDLWKKLPFRTLCYFPPPLPIESHATATDSYWDKVVFSLID